MKSDKDSGIIDDFETIAAAFVTARLSGAAIQKYPGDRPTDLRAAYAIQDAAIRHWPTPIAGWKVGGIDAENFRIYGANRLVGPVFKDKLWSAAEAPEILGVFDGGFAAAEGEIVAVLQEDAPEDKLDWTTYEALSLVGSLRAGAEIASSPYPFINEEGPLITISDFGNNFGLIVGDEIPNWRELRMDNWICKTNIGGKKIGEATPAMHNGGPIESLRYLLENTARRGMPLKKGMAICTGAITGVHEICIGQSVSIEFEGAGAIRFSTVRQMGDSEQADISCEEAT